MVIGGTRWPSITSTWMTRAPAAITSATCAPRREKSAERTEGATWRPPKSSRGDAASGDLSVAASIGRSDGTKHRVAAMLAEQVLRRAHANDRLVLTAVAALRDELVAAQAVDAAIAAGQLRGPKPRLAATRAGGALQRRVPGLHLRSLQLGDEEPVRVIAVGPYLQEPRIAPVGQLRRRPAEIDGHGTARGE